jgi:hypothetical protein
MSKSLLTSLFKREGNIFPPLLKGDGGGFKRIVGEPLSGLLKRAATEGRPYGIDKWKS